VDGDLVEVVAAALLAGEAVVLPTDTVYGLVAVAGDRRAAGRLFDLKGRDHDVPLAVLCASTDQALSLTGDETSPAVAAVASAFWPGPLTLVVARRAGVELHLGEPASTVGLRVPDHELVRALAARVGPLAATSANLHGQPAPTTADEVVATFGSGVAMVVDGGHLDATASTVIDATGWPWSVLRPGPISPNQVFSVAEGVRR